MIIHKTKYIKGIMYVPDSVDICPKVCNQYFSDEKYQDCWIFGKYELGTVECIKSFEITEKSWYISQIPKFDPQLYRIYEINDEGEKKSLQDEDGTITSNYFDSLMKIIMDDFYYCLNYYGSEID